MRDLETFIKGENRYRLPHLPPQADLSSKGGLSAPSFAKTLLSTIGKQYLSILYSLNCFQKSIMLLFIQAFREGKS